MHLWLLIAAAAQAASANGAAMKGLAPVVAGPVATARALNLRLNQELQDSATLPVIGGMIVQHGIAPNAAVGLDLSGHSERRKAGFDVRDNPQPKRSRKAAVTFLLKF